MAEGRDAGTNLNPQVKAFYVFNATLGNKEGKEHEKIMYYYPGSEILDKKIRNVGLTSAIIGFAQSFSPSGPCEGIHTRKSKSVLFEAEPDIWMALCVVVPHAVVDIEGEQVTEYFDDVVKDHTLQHLLEGAYRMFKLFRGSYAYITESKGLEGLKVQLSQFYDKYIASLDLQSLSIFTVYQGLQFLPLDKLVFMKIHQFVNKLESTYKVLKRVVFVYGSQIVWSGLERGEMQTFYHYLMSTLLPRHLGSMDLTESSAAKSFPVRLPFSGAQQQSDHSRGVYFLGPGDSSGTGRPTRVCITADGEVTWCQLCIYHVEQARRRTLAPAVLLRVWLGATPSNDASSLVPADGAPLDVLRKMESQFAELKSLSQLLLEFTSRNKAAQMDTQYRYIYFNSMNLAVKSPLLFKKGGYRQLIPNELMRILIEVDRDHQHLNACETMIQTDPNLWLVYRKSGHRQFAVFFSKDLNLFEVCEEVRKLCEKEFSSVFILD